MLCVSRFLHLMHLNRLLSPRFLDHLRIGICILALSSWSSLSLADTLHRSTAGEPDTLDPQKTFGATALVLGLDLFEGLTTFDASGKVVLGLAQSQEMSDDGRTFIYKLRDGLKWSDGTPLTADDFVYSFQRIMNPETAAIYAPTFYIIENARDVYNGDLPPSELGVKAPDPKTVVFTLELPVPYFPKMISSISGFPVPRHVIEVHGNRWTRAGTMVTNGAYYMAERVPKDFIRLQKNPHHHEADSVQINEVVYYPSENHETSFNRFRAGDIQVALSFPPNQLEWVRENMPESLYIWPLLTTVFVVFNHQKPPYDDVRVRKALSLAIDRETLVDRVLNVGMRPAYGQVPPEIESYEGQADPSLLQSPDTRIEQAGRLLADAGYGPDNPLEVELSIFTQGEMQKVAIAVQGMWQQIGVDAELSTAEFRNYIRRRRTGDFEMMISRQYAGMDDPIGFLRQFETRYIATGNNASRYSNPEFDSLVMEGDQLLDNQQRLETLQAAERIMLADHASAPLYYLTERRLINPSVKGWVENTLGFNPTRYLWLEP